MAMAMKKDLEKKGIEAGLSYDTRDLPSSAGGRQT